MTNFLLVHKKNDTFLGGTDKPPSYIYISFRVVVGEHDVSNDFDGQSRLSVARWESHPNYNSYTYDNDYAIITLEDTDEIIWNERVQPICLPNVTRVSQDDNKNTIRKLDSEFRFHM